MCSAPSAPPPPPERQAMTSPTDDMTKSPFRKRRAGFWSSVFTGASGLGGPPAVTGTTGGVTGG